MRLKWSLFFPLQILVGMAVSVVAFSSENLVKTVRVRGMVCSFCAQGLLKTARAHTKVSDVDISLEKKTMNLVIKSGEVMSDTEIQALVQDAGFQIEAN